MVKAFCEVLKDLWFFACRDEKESVCRPRISRGDDDDVIEKSPNLAEVQRRPIVSTKDGTGNLTGWKALVSADKAVYYGSPKLSFGNKLGSFSYGDWVTVIKVDGDFAEVNYNSSIVWVLVNDITEDFHSVFPNFTSSVVYGPHNSETVKLRRFIQDETSAGTLGLSLQSLELVLYALKQKGVKVILPDVPLRRPGRLSSCLRDVREVSVDIEPRTAAIMEVATTKGKKGFFGYVSAVRPDQSIVLKSVGRHREGEYFEEEFTKEEWLKLGSFFISFT